MEIIDITQNSKEKMNFIKNEYDILQEKADSFLGKEEFTEEELNSIYEDLSEKSSKIFKDIHGFEKQASQNGFFKNNNSYRVKLDNLLVRVLICELQVNQYYASHTENLNGEMMTQKLNLHSKAMKEFLGQLEENKLKVQKFVEKSAEIDKIMSNIYGFFGLVVGLLAFIFVNYQFISSAKDLGMGKMLMFMGIANIGLILGIFLILGILGDLLGQIEKLKNSLKIMRSGWLFLGIVTIIILGFSIDLFDRREKNLTIDKQIQEVQATQKRQYEELYNELNKKDVENGKLKNEIDSLKNEIENLKKNK